MESEGEDNRGSCLGTSGHDDRQRGGPALGYGSPWHAEGGRVHDTNRSRSRQRQRLRPSGEEGREWGEGKRGDEASAGLVEVGRRGAHALGRAAARALPRRTGRRRQHLLWVAAGCYLLPAAAGTRLMARDRAARKNQMCGEGIVVEVV